MSLPVFGIGVVFLALAAITGLFGFVLISEDASLAAKLFSAFFLFGAAGTFWFGWMTRTPPDAPPAR